MYTIQLCGTSEYIAPDEYGRIPLTGEGSPTAGWTQFNVLGLAPDRKNGSKIDLPGGRSAHNPDQVQTFEVEFDAFIFPGADDENNMDKYFDLLDLLANDNIYMAIGAYPARAKNRILNGEPDMGLKVAVETDTEHDFDNGCKIKKLTVTVCVPRAKTLL